MATGEITSGAFQQGTFPNVVLLLHEACVAGTAAPEQVDGWHRLAEWVGCGDGPVTQADIDRFAEARLAFLHQANGTPFDVAKLPPPDVCDVFERVSPAAAAIERMVEQKRRRDAVKPPARGVDRMNGIVLAGVIGFVVIAALEVLTQGSLSPEALGTATGGAIVPVLFAGLITKLITGGPAFRPLAHSAIFSGLAGGVMLAAAQGGAVSKGTEAASLATMDAVVSAIAICVLTAMVTGVLTILAPKPQGQAIGDRVIY